SILVASAPITVMSFQSTGIDWIHHSMATGRMSMRHTLCSALARAPEKIRFLIVYGALIAALGTITGAAWSGDRKPATKTATPIKHLIVVIGENRSFDHIFGVYKARPGQRIDNLLSRGIVNEDGTPGPNFGTAAQFTVLPQAKYFIGAPDGSKTAYVTLPPPDLLGVPSAGSDTHPPPLSTGAAAPAAGPSPPPA